MSDQEFGNLMSHEYDGIREYDNPTPSWWHIIFFLSIIWAVCYYVFFAFSPIAPHPAFTHALAQQRETAKLFGAIGDLEPDEATIIKYSKDEKMMAYASGQFRGNCASCHGSAGQGIVGPNLTDDSWKNITDVAGLYTVISEGANNGAMPSWKNRFKPNELVLLSSYVASLRGSAPVNGKAPEGDIIPPWPEAPAGDG